MYGALIWLCPVSRPDCPTACQHLIFAFIWNCCRPPAHLISNIEEKHFVQMPSACNKPTPFMQWAVSWNPLSIANPRLQFFRHALFSDMPWMSVQWYHWQVQCPQSKVFRWISLFPCSCIHTTRGFETCIACNWALPQLCLSLKPLFSLDKYCTVSLGLSFENLCMRFRLNLVTSGMVSQAAFLS